VALLAYWEIHLLWKNSCIVCKL